MKVQFFIAALAASAKASSGIDFNKLINGVSGFPVHQDIDNSLVARQASGGNSAYLDSLCLPNITNPNPIPPCISINTIESLCAPNGTTPLAYQAHAQCLCNAPSSFFADWLGCRRCLVTHGGLSEREYNGYRGILAAASASLCSGTPTTDFAAIFATATASGGAAQGPMTSSDQFPSQSAVSLYYSPSGAQGPGAITGSATAATRSGGASSASTTGSSRSSTSGGSSSRSGSASGAAASGSSGMAMATAAPLYPALALFGGMVAAAL